MNTDGTPTWYTDILEDTDLMRDMRQTVYETMNCYEGELTPEEVCSMAEIHPIFKYEVEEMMEEWEGA